MLINIKVILLEIPEVFEQLLIFLLLGAVFYYFVFKAGYFIEVLNVYQSQMKVHREFYIMDCNILFAI